MNQSRTIKRTMKILAFTLLLTGTTLAANFNHSGDTPYDIWDYPGTREHLARVQPDGELSVRKPPHFLFILLDDMGFNHISWNNPDVITPNLQALADDGVILDYNYAQAACSPSRGALMFGKYAFNTGMQHDVISYQAPECADRNGRMLQEKLKEQGYATYMVGKWHLGFCDVGCTPLNRGFDHFYGFYQPLIDYYTHTIGYPGHMGYDFRDQFEVDIANNGTYVTDLFTNRAIDLITNHDADTPMFMYLSHAAPHTPLQVPQEYVDMYPDERNPNRKRIKGMITNVDEAIGEVVQALRRKGMYDNSVIMFSSDNGGQAFIGDNFPLRGAKSSIFEGGTRVPGMFHSPLATVSGIRTQGLFHISDWHTTMLSLAGAKICGLDGVDQTRMLFHGGESARNEIVYNIDNDFPQYLGAYAIRVGDFKLIRGFGGTYDGWEQYGGVTYTHILDYRYRGINRRRNSRSNRSYGVDYDAIDEYITEIEDHYQLFHLVYDPEERINLADVLPHKVAELDARINELAATAREVHLESQRDVPEASPTNFNGIWESGWC